MKYQIELIIEILILLIGVYLAFFKTYLEEKGKNLATKEDIKEITLLVENVKKDLEYKNQTKIELANSKRSSLLKYHEDYNKWLYTILKTYFSDIDHNSIDRLSEILNSIRELQVKNDISKEQLKIYLPKTELHEIIGKLNLKIAEMQKSMQVSMAEIEFNLKERKKLLSIESEDQIIKYEENIKKWKELLEDFSSDRIQWVEEFVALENSLNFNHIYHEHLFDIEKKTMHNNVYKK
ncbi:hypothetical protein [Ascidiimonas sp. W6]|uniref:hypothetical protein n=1 Tax=Ascidiimonas meishanensis TaxID=3128903 RepID=UPI0030EEE4E0